jgi:hypothetical protein
MPPWLAALAALTALLALPVVIGMTLSREHHVTRRIRLRASREDVWARVSDLERQPEWRPGVQRIERLDDRDGHEVWLERGRDDMELETVERAPPGRLVRRLVPSGQPYSGQWTVALAEHEGGTEVAITEDGEVPHPLVRFFARVFFGSAGTLEGYLRDLARSFGEQAEPTE